jgi:molecular chaperone GrpE (heat shock protein)
MAKRGGQPGNDGGSKGRDWANAIRRALARRADSGGTVEGGLNTLADQFLNAVAQGGIPEFKEMGDRLDGRAAQAVTVSGDEDQPLVHKIVNEIVRPERKDG